jgi:hypothetical protein
MCSDFVFQSLRERVERPPVQVKIVVVAPISILMHISPVAYDNQPEVSGGTLSYDIRRDGVEEPSPALTTLLIQSL